MYSFKNFCLLLEGGNVFKDAAMLRIPKKFVVPTVKSVSDILGIDLSNNMLGSTGKAETSGDIDIAVDSKKHSKDEIVAKLTKWCNDNKLDPKKYVAKSGVSVHFKTEIVGMPKKYVQTDLMLVDDVPFAKFSFASNELVEGLKGAHRHILLSGIAKAHGLSWSVSQGLKSRTTGEVVENRKPDTVAKHLLLSDKAKASDISDIKTILSKLIEYKTFGSLNKTKEVLAEPRETIQKLTGVDIFSMLPGTVNEMAEPGFRTGVQHLYSEYKPDEYSMGFENFKALLEKLKSHAGKINVGNSKLSEKADGVALKFGITTDGKFFTQGSYSGVVTDGNFSDKIKHEPTRAAFEAEFDVMRKLAYPVLRKFFTTSGIRVHTEWLHIPLGTQTDGKVRFVGTDYDISKLGKKSTILIIKVTDFMDKPVSNADAIIKALEAASTDDIRFMPLELSKFKSIDLSKDVNTALAKIKEFEHANPDWKDVVSNPSRKRFDQLAKKDMMGKITNLILPFEKSMHETIMASLKDYSGKLGGYEGIVINLDGLLFKVINPEFHKAKGRI